MTWGDRAAEQHEKDQPSEIYVPCDLHEITNCSTCSGLDYPAGTPIHNAGNGWVCCDEAPTDHVAGS